MLNKLKPKSEFTRNIVTLMTGTSIAQAIPIAISPILTRIYTPADFGIFALYMSSASIFAILATGKYDLAIMLPKKDEEAINIVALSSLLTITVSIFSLILIILFNEDLALLLGNKDIEYWLYLIPISILLTGLYQSINYWSNRKKEYRRLSINRIIQSGTASTGNLSFASHSNNGAGLIIGTILGQFIATTILGRLMYIRDSKKFKNINKHTIFKVAIKYISFPKYILASEFITVLLFQLPIFFLSILYNSTFVGFYNLVQRMLGAPMTLLARSVSDVFKEKASSDYNLNGNCQEIYLITFKMLILLGFLPFTILFFYAPTIFSFIFGEAWIKAGEFAQILSIMFFLKFVSSPLSYVFYLVNKQKIDLIYHIYLLISTVALLYCANSTMDVKILLIIYSINYSIIYLIYIFLSYRYAKGTIKNVI